MTEDNNPDEKTTKEAPVFDIKVKRREKDKPKKPSKAELQTELRYVMNGEPSVMGLPQFKERFYVTKQSGVRLPVLETAPGLVELTTIEEAGDAVTRYTSALHPKFELFKWQIDECHRAAKYWLATTEPIEPKLVAWQGMPGFAYSRLPWPRDRTLADASTPLFDELFARIHNGQAVKHWIASLFFKDSYIQQYVWLYGEGGEGKGALARFVSKIFGPAATAVYPPPKIQGHWSSQLLGKRFVLFPDCNAAGFPASGDFKMLTGGDQVPIDIKFGSKFSAYLTCKYMFLSNECVQLSGEKADTRRAIYAEVEALPKGVEPDPKYEAKLWEEGGAFLNRIINDYMDQYADHGPIKTDASTLQQLIEHLEADFESVADRRLRFGGAFTCKPMELAEMVKSEFTSYRDRKEFEKFLKRRHGILIGKPVRGTDNVRYYKGLQVIKFNTFV